MFYQAANKEFAHTHFLCTWKNKKIMELQNKEESEKYQSEGVCRDFKNVVY